MVRSTKKRKVMSLISFRSGNELASKKRISKSGIKHLFRNIYISF